MWTEFGPAPPSDPWSESDTIAEWSESEGHVVQRLDLGATRVRYWARRVPRRGDDGSMTDATGWGPLDLI